MYQAVAYGVFDAFVMLITHFLRDFNLDSKTIHSRWIRRLLGRDSHDSAFCGELMLLQILRCVEAGASSQRRQEQFRRRHSLVKSPIFGGLIRHNPVLPCRDFKLHATQVLDSDFHMTSLRHGKAL